MRSCILCPSPFQQPELAVFSPRATHSSKAHIRSTSCDTSSTARNQASRVCRATPTPTSTLLRSTLNRVRRVKRVCAHKHRRATQIVASSNKSSTRDGAESPRTGQVASLNADDMEGNLLRVQAMVDTAMLAAFAGLAYYIGTITGLHAHLGSILPLPIVIATARYAIDVE